MIIVDAPSPCFKERSQPITAIIIHDSDGHDLKDILNAYSSPDVDKSIHYIAAHDGNIVRCIQDAHKAFHVGDSGSLFGQRDIDDYSIGIMVVACQKADEIGAKYTAEQFDSLITLTAELVRDYRIPLNHIVGHDMVEPANDPGEDFPWFEFLNTVGSIVAQEDITSDSDGSE